MALDWLVKYSWTRRNVIIATQSSTFLQDMAQPSTIELTAEGAVVISYHALESSPETLGPAIGK